MCGKKINAFEIITIGMFTLLHYYYGEKYGMLLHTVHNGSVKNDFSNGPQKLSYIFGKFICF